MVRYTNVKANSLSEGLSLSKKFFEMLFKGLDSFINNLAGECKSKSIQENGRKGKLYLFPLKGGKKLAVKVFPNSNESDSAEGTMDVLIQAQGLKLEKYTNVDANKNTLKSIIDKYMSKYELQFEDETSNKEDENQTEDDGTEEEVIDGEYTEVDSCKRLQVTLKRVAGSKEDTIHLTAINANYSIVQAMDVLDEVLEDSEFTDAITEEPASFEIVDVRDSDEYDVNEIDEVDTSATFEEMLRASVQCYHNIECIHWAAKGRQFREIHSMTESLLWQIKYNSDTIAEWCVEFTNKVPNVLSYEYSPISCVDGFDFESAIAEAQSQIDNYVAVLECYYVNLDHDVQSVMDNWIRELKKTSNYSMERTLMPDTATLADR